MVCRESCIVNWSVDSLCQQLRRKQDGLDGNSFNNFHLCKILSQFSTGTSVHVELDNWDMTISPPPFFFFLLSYKEKQRRETKVEVESVPIFVKLIYLSLPARLISCIILCHL